MTKEEYDERLKSIRVRHDLELDCLHRDFAIANNRYEVGDVIEDHIGYGEIVSIHFKGPSIGCYPQCVYMCKELTKQKQYKKNGSQRHIWQQNLIE